MDVDTTGFKPDNTFDLKKKHDAEFINLNIGRLVKKKGDKNISINETCAWRFWPREAKSGGNGRTIKT